jgi:hypothetical protein
VTLRPSFPANFAHINPHKRGSPVPPCLFEGSADELFHQYGIDGVLDQLALWLRRAAAGQLLDRSQGWEPARRDGHEASVIFDADDLIAQIPCDGRPSVRVIRYAASKDIKLAWVVDGDPAIARLATPPADGRNFSTGTSVLVAARAASAPGVQVTHDEYLPDTVSTFGELLARAREWGIDAAALKAALLAHAVPEASSAELARQPWATVVLAVERPVPILNAHGRTVELASYLVRLKPNLAPGDRVLSAGHYDKTSKTLLARVSGTPARALGQGIVQIGCGSVGSKVTMHLARAGCSPWTLVDPARFNPHNVARHALYPATPEPRFDDKADALAGALRSMGHNADAIVEDVVPLLHGTLEQFRRVVPDNTRLVVDSTAAGRVLAAVSATRHLDAHPARVCRTHLYGGGKVTVLMLEGPGRSPRVDDLEAALFAECIRDEELRRGFGAAEGSIASVFVGDTCQSVTMRMGDSIVSRGSALVAMQLGRWLADVFPDHGELCVGIVRSDGIGMDWRSMSVRPTTVVPTAAEARWTVRALSALVEYIDREARFHSPNETGGPLLGMVLEDTKTIVLVAALEAPPDSKRSPSRFTLGTEGLQDALMDASQKSLDYLQFVGTWHSHPMGGPFSGLDLATLKLIGLHRAGLPAVSLVWRPDGLIARVEQLA